jgi:phospholipid/cholesterol/gamma-HCH transport system substrate-binding protein
MNRIIVTIGLACITAALLSACQYHGLNSFVLPGAPGVDRDTYTISVDLPDANGLVANAEVKVNDVSAGSIRELTVSGWHAHAQVTLNSNVHLPANAVARVGLKSLLGSSYLELAPPDDQPAQGQLSNGATLRVATGGNYPQTEQVLAAASSVLNGGGLGQLDTITRELNHTLIGRTTTTRDLFTQLNTFLGSLNGEHTQIISALNGLNGLSTQLNGQTRTVESALDTIPPALATFDENEHNLTRTLDSLDRLSHIGTQVIHNSQDDLVANLNDLRPVLHQLSDSGDALAGSLIVAGTGIFPVTTADKVVRGDYLNVDVTLDLTDKTLDRNFLTGTPLAGLFTGGLARSASPLLSPPGLLQPRPRQRGHGDTVGPPITFPGPRALPGHGVLHTLPTGAGGIR